MRSLELSSFSRKMEDPNFAHESKNLAEKIFTNLNCVLDRDSSLDEFDIIPVESQSNRSPVIYQDHNLALESWCVPFLYSHSFRLFLSLTSTSSTQQQKSSSSSLNSGFPTSAANHRKCSNCLSSNGGQNNGGGGGNSPDTSSSLSESERVGLQLSRILILLTPDLTVAWNYRRSAFLLLTKEEQNTNLDKELNIISLVLSRKPKCSEGFSYRKWLIKKYLEQEDLILDGTRASLLFQQEAQECETAARKYFSNYHAWNYRHWLLETFISSKSPIAKLISDREKEKILQFEKDRMDHWTESHISDYSGFHYRQKVFIYLSSEENSHLGSLVKDKQSLFESELQYNRELIQLYPGHEGLWYHRRFLLYHLLHLKNHSKSSDSSQQFREHLRKQESDLVKLVSQIDLNKNGHGQHQLEDQNQNPPLSLSGLRLKLTSGFKGKLSSTLSRENFNALPDYAQDNILYSQRHIEYLAKHFHLDIYQNSQ